MGVSTKGKKYLGKLSKPIMAEEGMEVKPLSEMGYSETQEYIKDNYVSNILDAQRTFNFYNTGFSYDYDDDNARKEILDYYKGEADYSESELAEKTNYRVNDWEIVRIDTDDSGEEYEEELEELSADNTYNGAYLGLINLNWRLFHDTEYDKYFYVIHPHLGGDIRGNYGEAFILEGDDKDDLFYRFYEGFVSGSLSVYIKLKDALPVKGKNTPSVLLFDSQQDSDVALFEFYEDGSEINSKTAQQLVDDFQSFDDYSGDEFLEGMVEEYRRGKKAKEYTGGGYLDDTPKIYVEILGHSEGQWMELDGMTEGSEVMDAIQEYMDELNEQDGKSREEYRIADMEGFGHSYFYNEYMGESDFDQLLNSYSAYEDSDYPAELIFEYANDNSLDIEDAIKSMEDSYYGAYEEMSDFAEQVVSEGVYTPSGSDVYITDTDKRLISGEEADSLIDNMDNQQIIEESSEGSRTFANEESELEGKISDIEDEISALEDLQGDTDNDEDYDNITDTIAEKEGELEEIKEELENLEEKIADDVRQEVYDDIYDTTYDRLDNDLENWLSELGYEDYTDVNFLVIDYDSIADDLAQDYMVYEVDDKYYLFINYKGGGKIKAVGKPKDYNYYIVEKEYNKIISGHDSKKEALSEKSKLKGKHKYLTLEVYPRNTVEMDLDIDTTSFNSFSEPETFKYGGKVSLRSGVKASSDDELWKTSNQLKGRLSKARKGIEVMNDTESKNVKKNLSRVRAKNYIKHKTFNMGGMPNMGGGMPTTDFLPPDKTPEEKRKSHNKRLLTASRSIDNVKESLGGAKNFIQKKWEEADFGDGKGKAKFKLGGYIKGDEVLFKYDGKSRKGTITDELGNGDYAIFSGSGFGMSQSLVNEEDIEGYAPAYEKRKFLGVFNDGGQLSRWDSVVYFTDVDGEEKHIEYLHIHANNDVEAEKIIRQKFYDEDASRYDSPIINYVSMWHRGIIGEKPFNKNINTDGTYNYEGGGYVSGQMFEDKYSKLTLLDRDKYDKDYWIARRTSKGESERVIGEVEVSESELDKMKRVQPKYAGGGIITSNELDKLHTGFTLEYLDKLLSEKFPDSHSITVIEGRKNEQENFYRNKVYGQSEIDRSISGMKFTFPDNREHAIEYEVQQGSENTNYEFVIYDSNILPYTVLWGFKDEGDVDSSYVTKAVAFLQQAYGYPMTVEHTVMSKGGSTYAKGGKIVWVGDMPLDIDGREELTEEEAKRLAKEWKDKGYDDVIIEDYAKGGSTYAEGGEIIDTFTSIQGSRVMPNNPFTIEKENDFYVIKNSKGEVLAKDTTKEGIMNDKGMFLNLYAGGGSIEKQNKSMLENDAVQIEHHSEELNKVVPKTKKVPAWIVGKTSRINSDLSDVTHYLDGKSQVKKKFNSGGTLELSKEKAKKVFHLPYESAIYVPSTSNVDEVISPDEMQSRVDEVQQYLGNLFGGFSSAETMGGFVDSKGSLVNEDIIKVTSFSEKDTFDENKEEVLNQLANWSKVWGQEAMGFEFEGDLYYVPANYKRGGKLFTPKGREILYKDENVALEHNKTSDHYSLIDPETGQYMYDGGFVSDYWYIDSKKFYDGGDIQLQVGDIVSWMDGDDRITRQVNSIKEDGTIIIRMGKETFKELNQEDIIDVKEGKNKPIDIITKKIGVPKEVGEFLLDKSQKFGVWLSDISKRKAIDLIKDRQPESEWKDLNDKDLSELAVKRWMPNVKIYEEDFGSKITGILDWLNSPMTGNIAIKDMDFDTAVSESRIWHSQLEQSGETTNYIEPAQNRIIKEYEPDENGITFYWALIPQKECLIEKKRMGHCGATGKGDSLISLRYRMPTVGDNYVSDSKVTIAYNSQDGRFYQIKGTSNAPAKDFNIYNAQYNVTNFIYDLILTLIDLEEGEDERVKKIVQEKTDERKKKYKSEKEEAIKTVAKYESIIKKLEERIDSPDFDIDELDRVEQQIAGVKNEGKADYKKLDIIDSEYERDLKEIEQRLGMYKLNFNGFGSEYQDDWTIDSLNNEQKNKIFELKPNFKLRNESDIIQLYESGAVPLETLKERIDAGDESLNKYSIRKKLAEQGVYDAPDLTFEIEYEIDDLSRLFNSDYSNDTLQNMITGEDTYHWFDGSYDYYYEDIGSFIEELNKDNQQDIIDYMVENSDLTEEDIEEEGIEYWLLNDEYEDDFDNIRTSIAQSLTSSEEGAMLSYYYGKIKDALEEYGEVISLDNEGVKLQIDLSDKLSDEEIDYYEARVGIEDWEGIFREALGSEIDTPSIGIDDRYSDRGNLNEYWDGIVEY